MRDDTFLKIETSMIGSNSNFFHDKFRLKACLIKSEEYGMKYMPWWEATDSLTQEGY